MGHEGVDERRDAQRRSCARCGMPVQADALWCLQCGASTTGNPQCCEGAAINEPHDQAHDVPRGK